MAYTILYKINGKEVSEAEYRAFHGPRKKLRGGLIPAIHGRTLRPQKTIVSEALAVHPVDAAQAEANARKDGFNLHFDGQGRPHFNSFTQRDAYAKTQGFHAKTKRDSHRRKKFGNKVKLNNSGVR